ncbi:tRNA epoxyqueuosine(34) reductase QueG [Pelagicoccus enzymogenes]|uniref:tRNA epoxyqueuosine(34) reductase QueG n=1 Tax=Pelagicoccus enzymogenes TaxID=2773457 RepID=UPI00280D8474|nr:tRNA epoxyqueuosine(34) reductase QueG [Pelagicoccus enzymogenes]MDQ8199465.1 tRNA epoxyqueuosine(34) reductase QueG [Pelagicoccus enzymogenes]
MIRGSEKEALRGAIEELGFDAVRFTDLSPISNTRLKEWIKAGYHADMEWLARSIEKRLDPSLVLDGACSVIMLGVNYLPPAHTVARSQTGFAKYSLYRDYHDTVLSGLKALGSILESRFGLGPRDYRYYTDTGPVMERGWAAAAGMGWQGKNGMLISKEHGNWLLLATVFLPLEIEADEPLKKGVGASSPAERPSHLGLLCGKCTRCMDACPTDAIVEPGILDTRKCISYQTIENSGSIPVELRAKFGGRVYGCDICLDACPWNRFAEAGRLQLLEARYAPTELGLLDLLRLDVETYQELFRKMPQKRTKRRGLRRNACVAAGNLLRCEDWWPKGASERERDLFLSEVKRELLAMASQDEEPLVRGHAVWAVYQLCGDEAEDLLAGARARETDESVLAEYSSAGTVDATG